MKIEKINNYFGSFAEKLLRVRWQTLLAFCVVIVLSFIGMKRMVKETSFDDYFIEGDPMLVKTEEFKSHFGNDYYVGVLTQCDNHFTKKNLTTLRELSNELLDSLSYAEKIITTGHSLHNIPTNMLHGASIETQGCQQYASQRNCFTTR